MSSHQISSFENSFGTDFYSNLAKQQPCFGTTILEKQFKRSENTEPYFAQKQKLNIKQFQLQQKILLLKLQSKIDSIFNVLQNKVLSRKNYAFQTLNELSSNSLNQYTQRSLSVEYLNSIFSKISDFHKRVQTKLLSKAFSHILLRNIYIARMQSQILKKKKSPTTEKRDSQMLRVNSKVDEDNSLRVSDLEDGSNYIHNAKAKNKELKRQKEQIVKNVSQYMSQFDQILTHHEQYINKRR